MRIKGIVPEDFIQYCKPSMFIITSFCDFKCERECGIKGICQNSPLAKSPFNDFNDESIIDLYIKNDITKAIVFGGMEPFDQFDEMYSLIKKLREKTEDDVVIYTGYYQNEIAKSADSLKKFKNIIIKFGRFVPNDKPRYDEVLGITLVSQNQYAERIS